MKKSAYMKLYIGIIIVKVVLIIIFSSDYQSKLFIPFIEHFLSNLDNPWNYFLTKNPKAFPYPPLMLYIFSIMYLPYFIISKFISLYILKNLFFKLPMLIADFVILNILKRLFPTKEKEIIYLYFASPIVIYASYIHSQLDIVPIAILFLATYCLFNKRYLCSAITFGLSLSIKFNVVVALPLLIIYLLKNKKYKKIIYFIFIPIGLYALIAAPFILSKGYFEMVLNNREQQFVFDIYYMFRDLKLYLVILATILVYTRFFIYSKINRDLLISFLGLLFSLFVLLIPPMPAWYIWLVPFVSVFYINMYSENRLKTIYGFIGLSVSYLMYFIFAHKSAISDINFFDMPLYLKYDNEVFRNVMFTILDGCLIITIYSLHKYGVKSNKIYMNKNMAFIVGIGGDSGAGKTTLLSDLKQLLGDNNLLEIEGDGDHKWERGDENWNEVTHLNPKANHLHKQSDDLFKLKNRKAIWRTEYEHVTGKFTEPKVVEPKDFVVMCGLHPYYLPKMRKIIDLKIYIDTDEDLRRHWKIIRDSKKRGYSKEKIIEQIEKRLEDAKKFIYPQKNFSDFIINYYPAREIDVGNPEEQFRIDLKLTFDSSIELDKLMMYLKMLNVRMEHDYSEDLDTQYIKFEGLDEDTYIDFDQIANYVIYNKEEVLSEVSSWEKGYRGIIQLFILILISNKMKGE